MDQFDVPLVDSVMLEEMDLMTGLMIAASEAVARLSPALVDRILGVESIVRPSVSMPRRHESADPVG